jgi:hypothetical protein
MVIKIPAAAGELIDKITILEIKRERIANAEKLKNILHELDLMSAVRSAMIPPGPEMDALTSKLKTINEKIWVFEDEIRDSERRRDFGPAFVALARKVYLSNDERSVVKREINEFLESAIVEEKSYPVY